ncbi:DUF3108 domain-containing protein [Acinetobacter sp. MD2(2019)]|uniref:DUF3108 domain-containing protein n=1 Tax=Acinetobacter sp. MD2(2019) TaxID=2605273 RepID=UPI002D1EC8FE|nr:DUF3108 domain-containing protein [Acinetobacter sp. MD2(2019)]
MRTNYFLCIFSMALVLSTPNFAYALMPFHASYQFIYNEKNLGTAVRSLEKQPDHAWKYTFHVNAGALAAASESSSFILQNHQIQSISFSRTSRLLFQNNLLSITFMPDQKQIEATKAAEKNVFEWQPNALDELNAEIQVREDLQSSGLKNNYLIADAKGLDSRKFINAGSENITTPYGNFATIKVRLEHGDPNKNTIFWLAPKLDYAPVKVTHNDGSNSYGLLLTNYKASK